MRALFFLWVVIGVGGEADALAFPEVVRHGYTQCTACHFSSGGGGLLTPYGRSVSRELLSAGRFFFERRASESASDIPKEKVAGSTEAESREGDFLWGAVDLPSWLNLGAQMRILQLVRDTPAALELQFIPMQLDFEAAVRVGRFTALGTFGRSAVWPGTAQSVWDYFLSRRHWVEIEIAPQAWRSSWTLRAGRFYPTYGLMNADHTWATRAGLGFGPAQEDYLLEMRWARKRYAWSLQAIGGRPDRPDLQRGWGAGTSVTVELQRRWTAGLSAQTTLPYGADEARRRTTGGFHSAWGLSPQWYGMLDAHGIWHGNGDVGVAQAARLGWEFTQGVHVYLQQDFLRTRFREDRVGARSQLALGALYYPRPHLEFSLQAGVFWTPVFGIRPNPLGWLQLHVWL